MCKTFTELEGELNINCRNELHNAKSLVCISLTATKYLCCPNFMNCKLTAEMNSANPKSACSHSRHIRMLTIQQISPTSLPFFIDNIHVSIFRSHLFLFSLFLRTRYKYKLNKSKVKQCQLQCLSIGSEGLHFASKAPFRLDNALVDSRLAAQ